MEKNMRYGCMSVVGILLMLAGTLIIAEPVRAADSVEFTVELIDYDTEEMFNRGTLVITDLDKDTFLEQENDGTGFFDVDTANLPDFEYGDEISIKVSNLDSYRSCYYQFNLFDDLYCNTIVMFVYGLVPSGEIIVGDMAANGAGGNANWNNNNANLGNLAYSGNEVKISATYSWNAPAAPQGYSYRYEWYFKIKVTKLYCSDAINTQSKSVVVYSTSKCGDPKVSVTLAFASYGLGTCTVYFWFEYKHYQVTPGPETLLSSGSILPSPSSKTLTLV